MRGPPPSPLALGWLAAVAVAACGGGGASPSTSASGAPSVARADFSGRWTLDPLASTVLGGGRGDGSGLASGGGGGGGGGTGLGAPPEELMVTQTEATLTVDELRGSDRTTVVYRLDGGRTSNQMAVGRGGSTSASYQTRWNGTRLLTTITRSVTARGAVTRVEYREERYLADDGGMVVETVVSGGTGSGRRTVYRKSVREFR